MKRYLIVLVVCSLISGKAISQNDNIGFGFRAGASIAKLDGPSELGPNGEELEEFTMARGFHIGATVIYKFTDLVGMKAEFVYSQRGTEYKYDGPSYYVLGRRTLRTTTIYGNREQTLDLSNVFLDIPVLAYYKIGKLELCGGINTGILLASTAGGSTNFEGISSLGNPIAPFQVNLDHNYKKDEAGEASSETFDVSIDGSFPYTVPETVKAYYEFDTREENQYKTIDFGLVVGAAFYINEGLYLSARYTHGLSDADVSNYDVSLQSLNTDGSFKYRDDDNRNRSWQFSVGFSF
jgi:hypothetical protein